MLDYNTVQDFFYAYTHAVNKITKTPTKEAWNDIARKFFTRNFVLVRPSGNPLDRDGFVGMLSNGFVTDLEESIVSLDDVRVLGGGHTAIVVYTSDQKFKYKGTKNADRAVMTAILVETEDGRVQQAHMHRGSGLPIPKESRWSNAHRENSKRSLRTSFSSSSEDSGPTLVQSISNLSFDGTPYSTKRHSRWT